MKIEPYPITWERRLDFLPPLGLQVALDPKLHLYYCKASVSIQKDKLPSTDVKTPLKGKITINPNNTNEIIYEQGNPNPRAELTKIPQKELLEDIRAKIDIEIPDIVIHQRGVIEKVPDDLRKIEALDDSEYILRQERGSGNRNQKLRKTLGVDLVNPYPYIKADLFTRKILTKWNDPVLKRIRSALKTDWIVTDVKGYLEIQKEIPLLDATSLKHWWQDIGIPTPFKGNVDHTLINGQVFWMKKRKWLTIF